MAKNKNKDHLKIVPAVDSSPAVFQTPEEYYDYLVRECHRPHTDIFGAAFARARLNTEFPFAQYERVKTPFMEEERQIILRETVATLNTFAKGCDDYSLKFHASNEEIEILRNKLIRQQKELSRLTKSLIPRKGGVYRKHHGLRSLSIMPEFLVSLVEEFKLILELYDLSCDKRNRVKKTGGRNYTTKKQAVEIFWKTVFKEEYPDEMHLYSSSYETIAVSFLAYRIFDRCSYDGLLKLYRDSKKVSDELRKEIITRIRKPDYIYQSYLLKYVRVGG